jgi:hypothetical protein
MYFKYVILNISFNLEKKNKGGVVTHPICAYAFFKNFQITPTMESSMTHFSNTESFMTCLKYAYVVVWPLK